MGKTKREVFNIVEKTITGGGGGGVGSCVMGKAWEESLLVLGEASLAGKWSCSGFTDTRRYDFAFAVAMC